MKNNTNGRQNNTNGRQSFWELDFFGNCSTSRTGIIFKDILIFFFDVKYIEQKEYLFFFF